LVSKHGKAESLSIPARKLDWAVYFMLKEKEPSNMQTLFCSFLTAWGRMSEPNA
jgi:hypothetical protein